jgi:hypothetical protein
VKATSAPSPRIVPAVLSLLVLVSWVTAADLSNRRDETETTLNVDLTSAAWDAFNHHRHEDAISAADRCIQEFKEEADRRQADLKEQKSKQPPVGKVNDNHRKDILGQGVLNDVATCYWIKGRSAELLHRNDEAREDYRATMNYSYARTWDQEKRLFWSPAQDASDRLQNMGIWNWLTVVANLDGGYRRTQFYDPHYDTGVGQWDSRIEFWFPPGREKFSWGLYGRVAAIIGTRSNAWQNGALAWPGVGLQMYPFRGRLLGPIRIFGEYNFAHYWGVDKPHQGTSWRPKNQVRAGFEYWKAVNVNTTTKPWWLETWNGAFFQSANEFTSRESSPVVANSLRFGVRWPRKGLVSALTPYATLESSWDKYERTGPCFLPSTDSRNPRNPCDFFWENRFLAGGGLRLAPSLGNIPDWLLNRFVIYGEYLNTPTYYGPPPPSTFPRFDWRVGLSTSVGKWYK